MPLNCDHFIIVLCELFKFLCCLYTQPHLLRKKQGAYTSEGEIIQILVLHKDNIPSEITDSYTGRGKFSTLKLMTKKLTTTLPTLWFMRFTGPYYDFYFSFALLESLNCYVLFQWNVCKAWIIILRIKYFMLSKKLNLTRVMFKFYTLLQFQLFANVQACSNYF